MMKTIRTKTDWAVSEIVGTALLLGMAILFFSLLIIVVFDYPLSPASPYVNLVGTFDIHGNLGSLTIEHNGGDTLDLDTVILYTIDNNTVNTTVKNHLNAKASNDGVWNIGERVLISNINIPIKPTVDVGIVVIDMESNSVVMSGIIQKKVV